MTTSNRPNGWWRIRLLSGLKRIMDPADWWERWKGKQYRTPPKLKPILKQLQKDGVDAVYIEWLLRPEYLKGRPGHPDSRLPENSQREIVALFDDLDAMLRRMRETVDRGHLPGRPVESFRQWLRSFEKDVEPACPQIGGFPKVQREFRKKNLKFFRGRPREERVYAAFLISEELRKIYPQRYWPIVSKLLIASFPADKVWCTPDHLSRAVALLKHASARQRHRQSLKITDGGLSDPPAKQFPQLPDKALRLTSLFLPQQNLSFRVLLLVLLKPSRVPILAHVRRHPWTGKTDNLFLISARRFAIGGRI